LDVTFIYQLPTMQDALTAIERLDIESSDLMAGLGLFLLVEENGCADWYVFANLKDPTPEDRIRILGVLDQRGVRTDLRFSDMTSNPNLRFTGLGTAAQIELALRNLFAT
jgi:hypothetical protein